MRKIEKLAEEYMQKKYGTKMVIMPEESSIYEAKKKGYQDGIRKGVEIGVRHTITETFADEEIGKVIKELETEDVPDTNKLEPCDKKRSDLPEALLEEVQKMLDDCQKNWKAVTEANIESMVNRIAQAFLEVSEIDYGIGVKTMFVKMAGLLFEEMDKRLDDRQGNWRMERCRKSALLRAKDIAFELTQKFGELDYGDFAHAIEEELKNNE